MGVTVYISYVHSVYMLVLLAVQYLPGERREGLVHTDAPDQRIVGEYTKFTASRGGQCGDTDNLIISRLAILVIGSLLPLFHQHILLGYPQWGCISFVPITFRLLVRPSTLSLYALERRLGGPKLT